MGDSLRSLICLTFLLIVSSQTLERAEAAPSPVPSIEARIEAIERARAADDGTLASALAGSDLTLARRAALALGRTKREDAAPPLVAALSARDPSLRALSLFGLGLIARPVDLTIAARLANGDPSSAVRYAAADAIGRIVLAHPMLATAASATALERRMRSDSDAIVRGHAAANLDAFAAIPGAAAIARAIEDAFANESSADVRWHEMWVLYRAYATAIDPRFLAAQLQSRDELVRVEALRAVGKRRDSGAVHFVRPLVADASWRVQLQARETLLALDGQPPTQHLTSLPPATNVPPPPEPLATVSPIPLPLVGTAGLASGAVAIPVTPPPAKSFRLAPPSGDDVAGLQPLPLDVASAAQMNGPMRGPHPRVRLRTTKGDLVVRLYPEWAPVAVANFLGLTASGYFDGDRWFRVVPDFVHQTGDATNDPDHDAGYTVGAEENPIEQRSYALAMGLDYEGGRAVRDSAGTQFYVTDSPQLHLDRDFGVFGEIERGTDVLANLVETDRILTATRISDD